MGKLIMIVGEQIDKLHAMIKYAIPEEIAEFRFVKYGESYNKIDPDIVVFMDFEYKNEVIYRDIRSKFKDKKTILNSDNEYLFEDLACVDGCNKESYSLNCSWRTYHAAELSINEDKNVCKYEYYSPKYNKGAKVCFTCGVADVADTLLILVLSDLLNYNIYQAAQCLEGYFMNNNVSS